MPYRLFVDTPALDLRLRRITANTHDIQHLSALRGAAKGDRALGPWPQTQPADRSIADLPSSHIWDLFPNMDEPLSSRNRTLAEHLRTLRTDRGLTLQDLAGRSGVSRATLSRIEAAEVSPTAETLGRLASAFALPLSQLFTPLEPDFPPLVRHADQSIWLDHENGFSRRAVSPPSGRLTLEMIACEIEPYQRIAYERPAFPGHEHHLVLLAGALTLTVAGTRYDLSPGDCLRYRLHGASSFETADRPARYIIAMA